jgi:hypothetical protein
MALSTWIALLQDAAPAPTDSSANTIRIAAGVLALVLVAIVILRRKGAAKKNKEEDEF